MKSINRKTSLLCIILCFSVLFCFGCVNSDSEKGTYSGTTELINSSVSVKLSLKGDNFTVSLKQDKGETELFSGSYTITEDGKISFSSSDSAFPLEKTAKYNAEKRTVTVTHKFFGKSIVLKKQ